MHETNFIMINLIDSLKSVKRTKSRVEKIENRYEIYLLDIKKWKEKSVGKKRDSSRSFYITIHSFSLETGLSSLDNSWTPDHQAGPQYSYVQLLETHLETGQILSLEEFTLFCLFCGFVNRVSSAENSRIKEEWEGSKPFKYTHVFDKYDQGNIVVTQRFKMGNGYSRDLEDCPEFLPLRESLILPKFYDDLVNGSVLTFKEFDEKLVLFPDTEYNVLTLGVVE